MNSCANLRQAEIFTDKFGKVFIRKLTDTNDKNFKAGEYELVKGVRFSNAKLRIYRGDSEDDSYTGKRFSVGYLGQRLCIPLPMGTNTVPNTDDVDVAYKKEIALSKELKLIDAEDEPAEYQRKCKVVNESRLSMFGTFTSPTKNILEQDFVLLGCMFAYIDDLLETLGDKSNVTSGNSDNDRKKTKLPYKFTSRITYLLSQAMSADELDGRDPFQELIDHPSLLFKKVVDDDDNPDFNEILNATNDSLIEIYSWVQFIIDYLSLLRKKALETGKKKGCSATGFLTHVAQVMDVFCLEFSTEWHEGILSAGKGMLNSIVALRRVTAAGVLFVEMILLQNGIHLPAYIRSSALFKTILEQLAIQIQKVNDLVSFAKEMQGDGAEWRTNEACILHKEDGMTVEGAKALIAKEANTALEQVEKLSQLLLKLWKGTDEEKTVLKFIETINHVIIGHIQYGIFVHRYQDDGILDCYID